MKLVKNVVFAVVLVSAFAVNTPGGDMPSPGFCGGPTGSDQCAPPQPPQPKSVSAPYGDKTQLKSGQQNNETAAETFDFLLYEAFSALLSVF